MNDEDVKRHAREISARIAALPSRAECPPVFEIVEPRAHFDPARDVNHAVICPLCASLLSHYEGRVWTCENDACPFEATNEQMTAMLGRETRPTIPT